jgi:hypothetical protein
MLLLILLVSISVWTGTAVAQSGPSQAGPLVVKTANLPVVGVASSETVQVNVVNLAPSVAPVTTGGSLPGGGSIANCAGGISFYDANGNALTSATFTIGSGQIYSAPLPYSQIPAADRPSSGNGRTAVWATVSINNGQSSDAPCLLAANVETFDTATGVTHLHTEGATLEIPSRVSGVRPGPL